MVVQLELPFTAMAWTLGQVLVGPQPTRQIIQRRGATADAVLASLHELGRATVREIATDAELDYEAARQALVRLRARKAVAVVERRHTRGAMVDVWAPATRR